MSSFVSGESDFIEWLSAKLDDLQLEADVYLEYVYLLPSFGCASVFFRYNKHNGYFF